MYFGLYDPLKNKKLKVDNYSPVKNAETSIT